MKNTRNQESADRGVFKVPKKDGEGCYTARIGVAGENIYLGFLTQKQDLFIKEG
jgi:hypothetical protein